MSLKRIAKDSRVEEISDERDLDHGIFVYLKPGYINKLHEVHHISEDTVKECVEVLSNWIIKCNCEDC